MNAPATWRWRRRARPGLGTQVEVAALAGSDEAFRIASDAAFATIAEYHAAMSFHLASSDVRAIAATGAGRSVAVRESTWAVLEAALALEAESDGVFNVAVAPELVRRGMLPCPTEARHEGDVPGTSARAALRLDGPRRVHVLQAVWIDLGGIAKGAAVDAALDAVRRSGARAALVNAGGDLATYGEVGHAIRIPAPGPARALVDAGSLADGAIATSAPRDGLAPVDEDASDLVLPTASRGPGAWVERSVSVVAPRCLVADALTKVLALLGRDAAPLLARHGAIGFSVDTLGRLEHAA